MDPTEKTKHPIYRPSTSKNHHHHPHPNPTIQYISNNFSKLYTNHKMLSSLKATDKEKIIHSHTQQQPSNNTTTLLDSSCTTLTKSKSQHGTRYSTKTKVVKLPNFEEVKPFVKNPNGQYETTHQEWKTKESIQENIKYRDVKKAQSLMSRSYNEEFYDVQKPQSLMSKSYNSNESCYDVKKSHSLESRSYNEGFCGVKKAQSLMGRSICDVKRQSFSLGSNCDGRRRKSFCSSQTELADFFSCSGVKVVAVDMPPFMQVHAVNCARNAHDSLEKFTARSLASTLKREFDGVYGPAWHCIVGTSFGSFVTHSVGGFMYFSMDQKLYVLLFKTTVQKAE